MGNEPCCDDRNKGGDFNRSVEKVSKRQLNPIKTETVIKEFDNKASTKQHLTPGSQGKGSRKQESDPNISISLVQYVQRSTKQGKGQKKSEAQPDHSGILSRENSNDSPILDNLPSLNSEVQTTLQKHRLKQNKQDCDKKNKSKEETIIKYQGGQAYEGEVLDNIPNGFGKYYRKDGSFYEGQFSNGKANGEGLYIMTDGSFYKGTLSDNKLESKDGEFHSKTLSYKGGFKNNLFHGKGEESGDHHQFKGDYSSGQKASGILSWREGTEEFVYEGTFNQSGQFEGKGTMKEPKGKYEGQFQFGKKHGLGTYRYNNDLMYHGNYNCNVREGHGTLLNPLNKTAYEGNFENGLPHGEGMVHDKNGIPHKSVWNMGIDQTVL